MWASQRCLARSSLSSHVLVDGAWGCVHVDCLERKSVGVWLAGFLWRGTGSWGRAYGLEGWRVSTVLLSCSVCALYMGEGLLKFPYGTHVVSHLPRCAHTHKSLVIQSWCWGCLWDELASECTRPNSLKKA